MSRVLIFISAFFVFLYSNSEIIDKKIIGYTHKGHPIYCDYSLQEGDDVSSMSCVGDKNSTKKYETMITFNTFVKIYEGWNIVGIAHNIENVEEFLSADCILYAKKHEDGIWREYSALDGTNSIEEINSHDAIFIYSTKECELNNYGARTFRKDEIKIQSIPILDKNITINIIDDNVTIVDDNATIIIEEPQDDDANSTNEQNTTDIKQDIKEPQDGIDQNTTDDNLAQDINTTKE